MTRVVTTRPLYRYEMNLKLLGDLIGLECNDEVTCDCAVRIPASNTWDLSKCFL